MPRDAPYREFAERLLSRAAGAPLLSGNAVELLIDAEAHFTAWLRAIRGASRRVLLENYIVRDDAVGVEFRDALAERARSGVRVAVIVDWLGCLGQSGRRFWAPLRAAGGEVRVFNPPRLGRSFAWINRDHRKLLVVDGRLGFLSGVCLSAKWLGDRQYGRPPWRDTGVALRGPAVAELEQAFVHSWDALGAAFGETIADPRSIEAQGEVALRVIATEPARAFVYRLDQLVASMARRTLWLTDAYYVGIAPYVQTLIGAARDGVDVRLLVPGTSDVAVVSALSRSGYRPLLRAGIRVFEWNGSMLHAKTSVVDGLWARVGSSNLNLSSWLGNLEIDVAIEDAGFASRLAERYETDLQNATEIVLSPRRFRRTGKIHTLDGPPSTRRPAVVKAEHGSSRAAVDALRLANTVGVALRAHRVLGDTSAAPQLFASLLLTVVAFIGWRWPRVIAWPLALLAAWLALNLAIRRFREHRRRRHWLRHDAPDTDPPAAP
ncbi:MAG: cardiolipin synthase B [Gammaproteobacteria bacterium]|nr:cardiolipin synthase B [Gammaproteobacteria bacterium]